MTPELDRRLARLKMTALKSMREQTGPCHLGTWWDSFLNSIPKDAVFADLDPKTQELIRAWEKELATGTGSMEIL